MVRSCHACASRRPCGVPQHRAAGSAQALARLAAQQEQGLCGSLPLCVLPSCLTLRSSGQSTAGHVCSLRHGRRRRCLPLTSNVRPHSSPTLPMSHDQPAFPFFMPVPARSLTDEEQAVVKRLTEEVSPEYRAQVPALQVIGRCGCGNCPTIFFEPSSKADQENDLVTFAGKDRTGGLVAAVLLQKTGRPSAL